MAFSFAFGSDDIASDNEEDDQHLSQSLAHTRLDSQQFASPKQHTLQEFLSDLPSQISYNILQIPIAETQALAIPRRALFDITTQLLYEADPSDDRQTLIDGLANGDLQTGFYEGGFKTWECAVDLAGLLAARQMDDEVHVIELGAGSAVPSVVVLMNLLRARLGAHEQPKVTFTLCDYNEDVLRLCTAVNVFLGTLLVMQGGLSDSNDGEGEVDVLEETVPAVLRFLKERNIEIRFVSGAWGAEFLGLLGEQRVRSLVLASETIYSPESMDAFTKVIFGCLDQTGGCEVLVAAKKMYFGVGGGVVEFDQAVEKAGGQTEVVLDVPNAGVGRVILNVKKKTTEVSL